MAWNLNWPQWLRGCLTTTQRGLTVGPKCRNVNPSFILRQQRRSPTTSESMTCSASPATGVRLEILAMARVDGVITTTEARGWGHRSPPPTSTVTLDCQRERCDSENVVRLGHKPPVLDAEGVAQRSRKYQYSQRDKI